MNELLGWYGYGNVDRSDANKIPTSVQQVQQHVLDHHSNSNTTKSPVSRLSSIARETSSTPEQNSSSENSKSPILRKIINKQGVLHIYITILCCKYIYNKCNRYIKKYLYKKYNIKILF